MLSLLPGSTLTAPSFRLSHRERETPDEIGAELFPHHFLPIAKALGWGVGPSRARPHVTFWRSPLPAPVQPPWGPRTSPLLRPLLAQGGWKSFIPPGKAPQPQAARLCPSWIHPLTGGGCGWGHTRHPAPHREQLRRSDPPRGVPALPGGRGHKHPLPSPRHKQQPGANTQARTSPAVGHACVRVSARTHTGKLRQGLHRHLCWDCR